MQIILSSSQHLSSIMNLIHQAQFYFKNQGIDQWQDGYPNEDNILSDIHKHHSYVLINENHVIATMYFAIENDPNYASIEGKWKTYNQPYGVIHRIVVDNNCKGQNIALDLLMYAADICKKNHVKSIRIDTHMDNLSMQRFLKKNGFSFCGDIKLESGAPRIAFEKIIE